mmetsp:Transcript_111454/g.314703  ORF Transcript_111454/g.314703 Transcript_111454/m.314703 type:complete len:316 (+) Transcript_111454:97-1044(+)
MDAWSGGACGRRLGTATPLLAARLQQGSASRTQLMGLGASNKRSSAEPALARRWQAAFERRRVILPRNHSSSKISAGDPATHTCRADVRPRPESQGDGFFERSLDEHLASVRDATAGPRAVDAAMVGAPRDAPPRWHATTRAVDEDVRRALPPHGLHRSAALPRRRRNERDVEEVDSSRSRTPPAAALVRSRRAASLDCEATPPRVCRGAGARREASPEWWRGKLAVSSLKQTGVVESFEANPFSRRTRCSGDSRLEDSHPHGRGRRSPDRAAWVGPAASRGARGAASCRRSWSPPRSFEDSRNEAPLALDWSPR